MKKLLATAAVCGLMMAAAPANAEVDLGIGGFFKGYGAYVDQDDDSTVAGEARDVDMIRHTEVHFSGETTLDNGLTVGIHIETEADGDDAFDVEESYAYFSGGWGRVNAGAEDGAQYLLQVEAPSADSNVDGLRQYVQPVNYTAAVAGAATLDDSIIASGLDYEANATGYADKLTYLSPVFSGFQLGMSYTPDTVDNGGNGNDFEGVRTDDVANAFGAAYEGGVRYEGQMDNVGITLGAGYTQIDLEQNTNTAGNPSDDRSVWNVGADLNIGPVGIGASYSQDDYGDVRNAGNTDDRESEDTLVVGVDYTVGAFKLGASYLNQEGTLNVAGASGNDGVETDRYTGGVVYTYGPGMTFRGSVSYVEHDNVAGLTSGTELDATSVLLGTQINF